MATDDAIDDLHITLRIGVDVRSFYGVARVARALGEVETAATELRTQSEQLLLRGRRYKLLYFRVNSTPETSLLADPAWVAVFVGLIAVGLQFVSSYPQLKIGAKEISKDSAQFSKDAIVRASELINTIKGLGESQREQLKIGVVLYIDQIASYAPDRAGQVLRRAARIVMALGGKNSPPAIHVDAP